MAVPLLDLSAQHSAIRGRLREAMDRVLESQHFILGPEVEAFEREVAAYCRCRHAIGCSSGSDALLMALMAADVKDGVDKDEAEAIKTKLEEVGAIVDIK